MRPSRPPYHVVVSDVRDTTVSIPRLRRLLRRIEDAPAPVVLVIGGVVLLLGVFIVTRPLTSLWLLAVYVGVGAIATGVVDLADSQRQPRVWNAVISSVWIAGGLAVLIWLGRSLEMLPSVLAILLIIGGLGSLPGVVHGRASERVLAGTLGVCQLVLGSLALLWPDVTLLIAAVLFGLRMIIFGAKLLWKGGRRVAGDPDRIGERARTRAARAWADAARYAIAFALVVVTASAWWLNSWLAEGAPVVDAFYDAPQSVTAEPGQLLKEDEYTGTHPDGGTVRRILYTTTDSYGVRAVSSALVIVPDDPPPGPRPVISWNWGTTGVARGCAPSLMQSAATEWAIPGVEEALQQGWVIVGADYPGRGAEGRFPYLIGDGEARASIDAIRAAGELEGLRLSSDVVVLGHSQGGHAALWTEPVAAEYAPELRILGTMALSPVTDPLAMAREMRATDASAELSILVSWVLVPYDALYPDVRIDDYVATSGRTIVRELTQRCLSEPGLFVSAVTALGVSADRPLYPVRLTTGPMGRRLDQNRAVGPWESPLLVAWGARDEVVPPSFAQQFVDAQCAEGTDVRWVVYADDDHRSLIRPSSPFIRTLIRWTEARFDGDDRAVSDCARYAEE